MLQPFNSRTVSLESNVIPRGSNKVLSLFMSLIANSWLGPVTLTFVNCGSHHSTDKAKP